MLATHQAGVAGHQPTMLLGAQTAGGLPADLLASQLSALDLAGSPAVSLAGLLAPLQPALVPHSTLQYTTVPNLQSMVLGMQQPLPGTALPQVPAPAGPSNRRNEEKVRRTVYISDIDPQVTEAQLAVFFSDCGQLVDCRMCGDPNSTMRFAFIEFLNEAAARQAQSLTGSLLGSNAIRVSPSKTAIVPVNNTYLPKSAGEREQVARTVYVANLDRGLETEVVRAYFASMCGPVARLRVLGDAQHHTKIAFIEFASAASAEAALKCSGALLGGLPVRVSPSKTPVRCEPAPRVQPSVALAAAAAAAAAGAGVPMAVPGLGPRSQSLPQPLPALSTHHQSNHHLQAVMAAAAAVHQQQEQQQEQQHFQGSPQMAAVLAAAQPGFVLPPSI